MLLLGALSIATTNDCIFCDSFGLSLTYYTRPTLRPLDLTVYDLAKFSLGGPFAVVPLKYCSFFWNRNRRTRDVIMTMGSDIDCGSNIFYKPYGSETFQAKIQALFKIAASLFLSQELLPPEMESPIFPLVGPILAVASPIMAATSQTDSSTILGKHFPSTKGNFCTLLGHPTSTPAYLELQPQ